MILYWYLAIKNPCAYIGPSYGDYSAARQGWKISSMERETNKENPRRMYFCNAQSYLIFCNTRQKENCQGSQCMISSSNIAWKNSNRMQSGPSRCKTPWRAPVEMVSHAAILVSLRSARDWVLLPPFLCILHFFAYYLLVVGCVVLFSGECVLLCPHYSAEAYRYFLPFVSFFFSCL